MEVTARGRGAVAIALALVICSSVGLRSSLSLAAGSPGKARGRSGGQSMVETVRSLMELLMRDPLTVEEVVARVGKVKEDEGVPLPIELRPSLRGVRAANIGRYPDSGEPYDVDLRPARSAQPTVAELEAVFGAAKRVHTDMLRPWALIFYPAAGGWGAAGERCKVAIIVEVPALSPDLKAARATSITLRRDRPSRKP